LTVADGPWIVCHVEQPLQYSKRHPPHVYDAANRRWLETTFKNAVPLPQGLLCLTDAEDRIGYLRADGTWLHEYSK
jgi:hypothetical protein